jgi:prolyl-tRNA synthetase
MGSYGIGSGRLLACVAEANNDEHGLIWPISVAPFQVHLVSLKGGEIEAETLYQEMTTAGLEVLFDDRTESAGVKFNDADLIGVPIRLTVSGRTLKTNSVEFKFRAGVDAFTIPFSGVVEKVKTEIHNLIHEIQTKVVSMPYK